MPRFILALTMAFVTIAAIASPAPAQERAPATPPQPASPPAQDAPAKDDPQSIIARGIEHLLAVQEGEDNAEWPYEGVYRVRGEIPIGYRIGGTAICATALLEAPGYADDAKRRAAVKRAAQFILANTSHPLMNPEYDGGYDVRGWGYTYALDFLLRLRAADAVPQDLTQPAEDAIRHYISALQQTEIPQVGGWNYARGRGADVVSPPSPFMTAPTLLALFEARRHGFEVNSEVVERALKTLEGGRTPTGSIRYAGVNGERSAESVPGSVGRMLAAETALYLAGRSSVAQIRSALDAFIVHWQWLDQRRAQQGTHVQPYGIAPYYFYYAHYHAALAVELLPPHERAEYRRRIRELLMLVRLPDGTWNDRVFARSSNYGTATSMLALMMPEIATFARWEAAPAAEEGAVTKE